jgi:hypothetical protein
MLTYTVYCIDESLSWIFLQRFLIISENLVSVCRGYFIVWVVLWSRTFCDGSFRALGPFVTRSFRDGTLCDGSFCDGSFREGTFCMWITGVPQAKLWRVCSNTNLVGSTNHSDFQHNYNKLNFSKWRVSWDKVDVVTIPVHSCVHSRDSLTRFSTSGFFHKSTSPRPLINTLKYFRILFRIRGAIRL